MKFLRVLATLALIGSLGTVAEAASLLTSDLDSPAFDLSPPSSNSLTSPGAITLGLPSNATTTVSWLNNGSTLLLDSVGAPLSQGVAGTNRDGMLVQLGYFTAGTAANNFAGEFIPLTIGTRIGDSSNLSGAGAGRVQFTTFFSLGSDVVNVFDLSDPGYYMTGSFATITATTPAQGQILAIRFFDTTNGASGFFNTVSADSWAWQSPSDLGTTVVLDLGAVFANNPLDLEWQDAANPFRTLIPIPEPSTGSLVLLGTLLSFTTRRRRIAA